jgi:hypothetical protein
MADLTRRPEAADRPASVTLPCPTAVRRGAGAAERARLEIA